jgi:phenylacetate-CoA ligase
MVCYQKHTVTCPCISAYLDQAGFVKVNLHPNSWHAPGDAAAYLDACSPDTYSGDPISFAALMKVPLKTRPKALVSTAMALTDGFHQALEAHFQAPVVDLYSMTETGPVAAGIPGYQRVLPHHIYVEILDEKGFPLPPGERGEVVLTGGFNPYLPLVRYRTGDWAALSFEGRQPVLVGLEGRPPVLFVNTAGDLINNIDVTHVLRPFGLVQYTLHQHSDTSLSLAVLGSDVDRDALIAALRTLFGESQEVEIRPLSVPLSGGSKVVQYTSELECFDPLS